MDYPTGCLFTGTMALLHNLLVPLLPTNQVAIVGQAFVKYKAGHL
ncbi:hypothetical protein [Hymenobacter coccineus]|nr:hypothetical protein [Hymenobacter coccineus]